ncbi:unnamed protein product [Angiostrongylus costaricensis]|uniref:Uncharacterized protein n=1 Tax=Angiostrongylus costaricensis TaxID=334426 RepID=A0A0R3PK83_ANGCS|nr:unnamed protein product [Angiostrongylus costaricensis]
MTEGPPCKEYRLVAMEHGATFRTTEAWYWDMKSILKSFKREQPGNSFHGCAHERENKRELGDEHCENRPAPTERSDESCNCVLEHL